MRTLAIALLATLVLSGCSLLQAPRSNQGTTTAAGFEDAGPNAKLNPSASVLTQYLMTNKCQVLVVIPNEDFRKPAEDYVEATGAPTGDCPSPQIQIIVSTDGAPSSNQSNPASPYFNWAIIPYGTS
jgi:hypothetical protein